MRSLFASTLSDLDLIRTGESRWCLRLPVPGFGPQDLDLTLDSGLLTVSGARSAGGGATLFRRSLALPRHLDVTRAALGNGLLEIELARTAPRHRRIPIGGGKVTVQPAESLLGHVKRRVGTWLDRLRQPARAVG